jgi:predicted dehydrogenase
MESLGIGMLGFGGIGKLHTLAWRTLPSIYPGLPPFTLAAVCTRSRESGEAALREGGFARRHATIEELVADPEVQVIDCVLPNDAHKAAIAAALSSGKHIYCEKPLALSGAEARELAGLAAASKGRLGMTFNYRFFPAIIRAKSLIDEGALGEIYSFEFEYLHSGYQDPSKPLTWRIARRVRAAEPSSTWEPTSSTSPAISWASSRRWPQSPRPGWPSGPSARVRRKREGSPSTTRPG